MEDNRLRDKIARDKSSAYWQKKHEPTKEEMARQYKQKLERQSKKEEVTGRE